VGQLALSLALVAIAGLFVRAAMQAARIDPGFAVDRHVIVTLDPSLNGADAVRTRALYRDALARIRALPGVERASADAFPAYREIQESRSTRLALSDEPVSAEFNAVGADYFAAFGTAVLRGREFTAAEEAGGTGIGPAIVDRALAQRLFGGGD